MPLIHDVAQFLIELSLNWTLHPAFEGGN